MSQRMNQYGSAIPTLSESVPYCGPNELNDLWDDEIANYDGSTIDPTMIFDDE